MIAPSAHKPPKVSVIIPTYNRGWVLAEAIESVLEQDFADYELIVVDDGSTDETNAILKAYRDQIRILQQNNNGVSAARNAGVRAAGTLCAAAFLENFVGNWPWAHVDIAYMDLEPKGRPYIPKGATGWGVRLLTETLANWKKV